MSCDAKIGLPKISPGDQNFRYSPIGTSSNNFAKTHSSYHLNSDAANVIATLYNVIYSVMITFNM